MFSFEASEGQQMFIEPAPKFALKEFRQAGIGHPGLRRGARRPNGSNASVTRKKSRSTWVAFGLLLMFTFGHALRVSELVALTWDQIHFEDSTFSVKRIKNGRPAVHFLEGSELRELKRLRRESAASRFVFCSERGGSLTT